MSNKKDIVDIIYAIKREHRKRRSGGSSNIPPDGETRGRYIPQPYHQNIVSQTYGQNDLKSILLPLSQAESIIYIDNLANIVIEHKRNSIRELLIYAPQEVPNRQQLCERVAQTITSYRDQFPADYDTSLSKKEKMIGLHLMGTAIPPSVLDIVSKTRILPTGERVVEKVRVLPGLTGIIEAIKVSLGIGGGLAGAGFGSAVGPPGALAGAIIGFLGGYFSPAIAGGAYMITRKKTKVYEKQEYDRIRNALLGIANQIRLQEIPIVVAVLPDFRDDNIQPYLEDRTDIQFREPARIIEHRWINDAFKDVVDNPDIFSRATYNMQRYYRSKVRTYETAYRLR